jgi:hypothetical protein
VCYVIYMKLIKLRKQFEELHALTSSLWDSSKSLQGQSDAYGKAWQARFEVGQEIARLSTPAPRSSSRCRDWQLKFESQKDC